MPSVRARKVLIVARGFLGESVRQPSYAALILFFLFMAPFSWLVFTHFGMGQGASLLLETALGSLTLLGLLVLLTIGTNVFHEEIRKRTIVTILSKPIGSGELVLGKFIGMAALLVPAYSLVAAAFVVALSRMDVSIPVPTLLSGILLSFAQVLILASVGLALSVHLPLAATTGAVVLLFAAGNLLPYARAEAGEAGWLIGLALGASSVVIPDLNVHDLTRAASLGTDVPLTYVGLALVHALLYGGATLFITTWLLDRREVY